MSGKLFTWLFVGGLFGVLLLWLLCRIFGWCPTCPDPLVDCDDCPIDCERLLAECQQVVDCEQCVKECEECREGLGSANAAELILEDSHVAAWMTLDNAGLYQIETNEDGVETTVKPGQKPVGSGDPCSSSYADPESEHRNGILFQVGKGQTTHEGKKEFLGGVKITWDEDGDGTVEPGEEETLLDANHDDCPGSDLCFDWLDINTVGEKCVIDSLFAYGLFQNNVVNRVCDSVTLTPASAPDSCLRNRALHSSMEPVGLLTYWTGTSSYYDMVVYDDDADDIGFRFGLKNAVTLDHWLEGNHVKRYEDVTEIRLLYSGPTDHASWHDNPMDGGNISP